MAHDDHPGSDYPTTDYRSGPSPSDDPGILGLDNVRLDLPLAGLGSRGLAVTLDIVLLGVLMLVWFMLIFTLAAFEGDSMPWLVTLFLIGSFLIQWGYFVTCEVAMDGQTPGKTVVGLRTVGHLGGRPSVGAILVRNLLRTIDYLVGPVVMVLDPRRRRLGDMVASTLVVHDREDQDAEAELRLGRIPESWAGREVAVVESFLRRAPRMEPSVAEELGRRLLEWVERKEPEFVAAGEASTGGAPGIPSADPIRRLYRVFATEAG